MSNTVFLKVLLGAILLGILYGAVFYAGLAFGRTQAEPASADDVSAFPTPAAIPQTITFTAEDVAEMRKNLSEAFGGELPQGVQDMLDQVSDGGTIDLQALRQYRQQMGGGLDSGMFDDNR